MGLDQGRKAGHERGREAAKHAGLEQFLGANVELA